MRWTVVALGFVATLAAHAFASPAQAQAPSTQISYTRLVSLIEGGQVRELVFEGRDAYATLRSHESFESRLPHEALIAPLTEKLMAKGVEVVARPPRDDVPSVLAVILNWLPLVGIWVLFWLGTGRPLWRLTHQLERLLVSRDA